jgi:redox-sensitive bicupin YhaK (pirin superfamily)
MITIRKSADRGHMNHGWLDTYHTFSFDRYVDREWMGFRSLRVINEDWIAPGTEFPTHPHRDMEIITYIISGRLSHKDSMGNGSIIVAGEVQRMSAGSGVTHSESNNSELEATHLLQIWLYPETKGITPSYEQKRFDPAAKQDRLCLLAARDGRDGALKIHQDCDLYSALLESGRELSFAPGERRGQWLQLITGTLDLSGKRLSGGDGAAIEDESELRFLAHDECEFLLFDMG